MRRFHPIIPAGGSGTRLWPLSRANRPKFLLPLPGPDSMIQATVRRLLPLSRIDDLLIVAGPAHAIAIADQIPELPERQIIVEPMPRGSGPAIGLGTAIAARRDPDALIGSFAADHVVNNIPAFHAAIQAGIAAADAGYLVTIGIQPSYAETGYGYIRAGRPIRPGDEQVFEVAEFKEKPDRDTATRYLQSGGYLWNASMFLWRADVLLAELRRLIPDLADALDEIAAAWDTPRGEETLLRVWPQIRDVTIDHGIMEHSDRVAVVPADIGWADLGDWHGFGAVVADLDGGSVVRNCEAIVKDSNNVVIFGNERLIAVLGLDNVIVVDTDDAVLVCERTRAQDVRQFVEALRQRGSTDLI